jgi:excisionase family DNA binding protein
MTATPFFTRRELAEHLRVSTRLIDRLCREGRLRFHRVGSRKRFSYDDVLAYLESRHSSNLSCPAQRVM